MANALKDGCSAVENLAVLETQDGDPRSGEPEVARMVTQRRRIVPGTIGFDDE